MKKIVITKHIHSTFATCSSSDEYVSICINENEMDFKPTVEQFIQSKNFPFLNGERVNSIEEDRYCKIVYVTADTHFYNLALANRKWNNEYHKTSEFKELVEKYKAAGFKDEEKSRKVEKKYFARQDNKRRVQMKKEGYILWMENDCREQNDFQGGFSNEVFDALKEYIKDGKGVFGYVGHTVRKIELDKVIERVLRERKLSPQSMAVWITSSDGRHFADNLEGETFEKQKEKIENYANEMFNLCLIYGSKFHGGTLESTIDIRTDYQNQGILLPKGNVIPTHFDWERVLNKQQ